MRALVTGSEGFLGRHFVKHLRQTGYIVMPVDVRHTTRPVDARDFFRTDTGQWDLVVHCAAVVNGRQVIENSPMDQVIDFELDAALFRWLSQADVAKTVYFSSSAAYPVALQDGTRPHFLSETEIDLAIPQLPDALYGWTKLTGEFLAQHAREAGHDVLVVRPFSGYGEDQADCYPFPAIMQRAFNREDPFVIWGSADQVRDFIHVDDIVGAVLAFVEAGIQGPINIGTGFPTTMRELALTATMQLHYVPKFEPLTDKPAGVMYRVAQTVAMLNHYTPKISIEEGVARALAKLAAGA